MLVFCFQKALKIMESLIIFVYLLFSNVVKNEIEFPKQNTEIKIILSGVTYVEEILINLKEVQCVASERQYNKWYYF